MNQIITKSEYNKDAHKKLYYFSMFRRSASFYFMLLLILGLGAYVLYNAISSGKEEEIFTGVLLVLATMLLTPTFMFGKIGSNLRKDEESRKGIIETIVINKEKISRKLDGSESVVIGWKQVEAIYERKNYYFFFLNGDQSLIVDKSKFIEGDSEVLVKLVEKYGPLNRRGKSVLKKLKVKK